MDNLLEFKNYNALLESKMPTMKLNEILSGVDKSTDVERKVLVTAFKCKLDFIDTISEEKHLFRINDINGKIMQNNRISFESMIFRREHIEKIMKNIVKYAIKEFNEYLPETITIFGLDLNPESFLDKDLLKDNFDAYLTFSVAVELLSEITGFTFEQRIQEFYIWTKNK